jgi:hypothetical protein
MAGALRDKKKTGSGSRRKKPHAGRKKRSKIAGGGSPRSRIENPKARTVKENRKDASVCTTLNQKPIRRGR